MRLLAVALLALLTLGCSTWGPARMDEQLDRRRPTDIRVVRVDGSTAVLHDARIRSDSIRGLLASGESAGVALPDVQRIETRRTHPGTWLMSAMVVAGAVVGFVIADDRLVPAS